MQNKPKQTSVLTLWYIYKLTQNLKMDYRLKCKN